MRAGRVVALRVKRYLDALRLRISAEKVRYESVSILCGQFVPTSRSDGCGADTIIPCFNAFNLVSHCQLKVCMYRAIKKALPLSVCETDTTTVVEVDKGQRFITSVNYVLLIRSSYRSRIANIAIHFEFAKKYEKSGGISPAEHLKYYERYLPYKMANALRW